MVDPTFSFPSLSYLSCFPWFRVKSLSKSGNTKKETVTSTINLKESTTMSLSSSLPPSMYEDDTGGDSWPEQTDKDEYDEEFYEQEKLSWKRTAKLETYNFSNAEDKVKKTNGQTKWKEPPKPDTKYSNPDDDLNALLKVYIQQMLYIVPFVLVFHCCFALIKLPVFITRKRKIS